MLSAFPLSRRGSPAAWAFPAAHFLFRRPRTNTCGGCASCRCLPFPPMTPRGPLTLTLQVRGLLPGHLLMGTLSTTLGGSSQPPGAPGQPIPPLIYWARLWTLCLWSRAQLSFPRTALAHQRQAQTPELSLLFCLPLQLFLLRPKMGKEAQPQRLWQEAGTGPPEELPSSAAGAPSLPHQTEVTEASPLGPSGQPAPRASQALCRATGRAPGAGSEGLGSELCRCVRSRPLLLSPFPPPF